MHGGREANTPSEPCPVSCSPNQRLGWWIITVRPNDTCRPDVFLQDVMFSPPAKSCCDDGETTQYFAILREGLLPLSPAALLIH